MPLISPLLLFAVRDCRSGMRRERASSGYSPYCARCCRSDPNCNHVRSGPITRPCCRLDYHPRLAVAGHASHRYCCTHTRNHQMATGITLGGGSPLLASSPLGAGWHVSGLWGRTAHDLASVLPETRLPYTQLGYFHGRRYVVRDVLWPASRHHRGHHCRGDRLPATSCEQGALRGLRVQTRGPSGTAMPRMRQVILNDRVPSKYSPEKETYAASR